jgi:outer membrane protein OmpA-like peptidoglycan-associated protein
LPPGRVNPDSASLHPGYIQCCFTLIAIALLLIAGPLHATDCNQAKQLDQQAQSSSDPQQRANLWRQASELCPHPLIAFRAGDAQLAIDQPQAALAAFSLAKQKLNPNSAEAELLKAAILGNSAKAYLQLNQLPEALAAIDDAFESPAASDPELAWLWQVRKAVDQHPDRQTMTAEHISRSLATRSVGSSPRIDLYVPFDYDQDSPNPQGLEQAKQLGQALKALPGDGKILVLGHTDSQGTAEYNDALSQRRAEKVVQLLSQWHPEMQDRFKTKGMGERRLRYPEETEQAHQLNRRVEVRLLQ